MQQEISSLAFLPQSQLPQQEEKSKISKQLSKKGVDVTQQTWRDLLEMAVNEVGIRMMDDDVEKSHE